jgi:hypothetical protein
MFSVLRVGSVIRNFTLGVRYVGRFSGSMQIVSAGAILLNFPSYFRF